MADHILKPGVTRTEVISARKYLYRWLVRKGRVTRAAKVRKLLNSTHYDAVTVAEIKLFQHKQKVTADGVIGQKTWDKLKVQGKPLGIKKSVPNPNLGRTLRGIAWIPGVVEIDGNWVAEPLAKNLLRARHEGVWTSTLNSGWRPDWYQAVLFKAALAKYGSYQAAARWVAPPGVSNHRHANGYGAVDVNNGPQLYGKYGFYQAMAWESWHLQLAAFYGGKTRSAGMVPNEVETLKVIAEVVIPDDAVHEDLTKSIEQDLLLIESQHEGEGL